MGAETISLLDPVASLVARPDLGLVKGAVGTVVEELAPGVFEVEFLDRAGHTIALGEFEARNLLRLWHEPAAPQVAESGP
jgi:hypothetical protein